MTCRSLLLARLEGGAWPGLACFYARYRPGTRRKAVLRDWTAAIGWIKREPTNDTGVRDVRKNLTSTPVTHRRPHASPGLRHDRSTRVSFRFLRQWWTALALVEPARYTGRSAPAIRMLLRALGEAGMKTGSRYVEFGTRSLDLAAGVDRSVVARHLRRLRAEDDPLIVLIADDRGLLGDLYELRIPDQVADRAARQDFRAGKIHALRPVFRDLGLPAAFVYEALEQAKTPPTSFELAATTGMARSTVHEALRTPAAYNLAARRGGRWQINTATSLTVLAETLGCVQVIAARLARHRLERAQYRRALRIVTHIETVHPTTPPGSHPPTTAKPPCNYSSGYSAPNAWPEPQRSGTGQAGQGLRWSTARSRTRRHGPGKAPPVSVSWTPCDQGTVPAADGRWPVRWWPP